MNMFEWFKVRQLWWCPDISQIILIGLEAMVQTLDRLGMQSLIVCMFQAYSERLALQTSVQRPSPWFHSHSLQLSHVCLQTGMLQLSHACLQTGTSRFFQTLIKSLRNRKWNFVAPKKCLVKNRNWRSFIGFFILIFSINFKGFLFGLHVPCKKRPWL